MLGSLKYYAFKLKGLFKRKEREKKKRGEDKREANNLTVKKTMLLAKEALLSLFLTKTVQSVQGPGSGT